MYSISISLSLNVFTRNVRLSCWLACFIKDIQSQSKSKYLFLISSYKLEIFFFPAWCPLAIALSCSWLVSCPAQPARDVKGTEFFWASYCYQLLLSLAH